MAKVEDLESCLKNIIKEMEKELAHKRKVNKELEMDHLMLELEDGRSLHDLSQTEKDDLKSYVSNKIACLERNMGRQDPSTSVNKPIGNDIPKASDLAPVGGSSFRQSDDDENMESNEGESRKSGGVDDA